MKSILIILTISFLVISCNNNKNGPVLTSNSNKTNTLVDLIMPNEVEINKIEEGVLKYNLKLDTIKSNEISSRYLFLHYTMLYPKSISFDSIKNGKSIILEDTLLTGKFNFKFDFNKVGNGVFNAAIEDIIILKEKQVDGKVVFSLWLAIVCNLFLSSLFVIVL